MARISVVIPVFNGELTIKKTLTSVLRQTWQDFEIWVIDDGSTDSTLKEIESCSDHRLQVISQANQGVMMSRNRGIQCARGEYIAFLDADDLWLPEKLSRQVQCLEQSGAAAVYCWSDAIDANDRPIRSGERIVCNGFVYCELLKKNFIETPSNLMVCRSAVEEIGGFDPQVGQLEDWDFNLRLAEQHQFCCVPEVGALYRKHLASRSSHVLSMELAGRQIIHRSVQKLPQVCPEMNISPGRMRAEAFADFYSYLFYVGFQQCGDRASALSLLRLFVRGLRLSPALWRQIPKRWLLTTILKAVTSPKTKHISREP